MNLCKLLQVPTIHLTFLLDDFRRKTITKLKLASFMILAVYQHFRCLRARNDAAEQGRTVGFNAIKFRTIEFNN